MSQTPMGFKTSPILQEHICRIGSKLPFEEAAEELSCFLRLTVNAKKVERICHCYGEQIDQVDWQEAYSSGVQLKFPGKEYDPVYCMVDGSMLLTREEKWKEIKLGRIFSESFHIEGVSKNRGEINQSIYSAHFGKSDEFWERFSKEIPINRHLVFINDGAKWIWKNIEAYYPESTQILDYFHCKEHVSQFAKEYYSKNKKKGKDFLDQIMDDLMNKRVSEAINTIENLVTKAIKIKTHRNNLVNYLTNNKKRIDYGTFKEKGLLIGSGPIEAAHRDVIQKRLKLSGQRWTIPGAQQIVNLRVYQKSNKWDNVVSLITQNKIAA